MKKVWKVLSYVLVAVLASVVTLAVSSLGGTPADASVSKLEQLEALIRECFIGDADVTAMENAAAEAMVDSLGDRWSYYMSAEDYASYKDQMANSYVGIGVTIQVPEEGEGVEVIKVTEGGPAEEAGLLAGDRMVAVDGVDIREMTTAETGTLVKGAEGTTVDITVIREARELTFTVERRTVLVAVATYEMLEDNIGLVTIANFDSRCAEETIAAMEALLDQGAQALIFDVRNNPGGYARELVKVLDYLLPEGDLFRTVNYADVEDVDRSDAKCLDIPMAVLVNGNSYSAAEFFAAALLDYEAAVVVGEQTCGKGYFQYTYELNDGSAVGLSVGEYFTPKGENLAGVGITPDVQVPVDEETAFAIYAGILEPEEDPQIQEAVAALKLDK